MSTSVLFFGGYKATAQDVNAWLGSAKAQKPEIEFNAVPWPQGAGAGATSAVGTFRKTRRYGATMAAVESTKADRIYIVGHSSGCAIANAVDRAVGDHSHIVLVALDGFVPDGNQLKRPSTQVWAAVCGDAKSKNYKALQNVAGARLQVYKATDCKTMWALHFSLVNAAGNDKVVTSIATGYAQCRANLVWL